MCRGWVDECLGRFRLGQWLFRFLNFGFLYQLGSGDVVVEDGNIYLSVWGISIAVGPSSGLRSRSKCSANSRSVRVSLVSWGTSKSSPQSLARQIMRGPVLHWDQFLPSFLRFLTRLMPGPGCGCFVCRAESFHGREPDGVTSCYPILQDGRANRWQVNIGRYEKMQKFSMYPNGPMNGQKPQVWCHTIAR